jgi:hypothetical protein
MGFWNPFWFEWKAAAYAALNELGFVMAREGPRAGRS